MLVNGCCYRLQTKLRQGNVFAVVCDSVRRGGGLLVPGGCLLRGRCLLPGGGLLQGVSGPGGVPSGDSPGRLLLRAVRILLE